MRDFYRLHEWLTDRYNERFPGVVTADEALLGITDAEDDPEVWAALAHRFDRGQVAS